MADAQHLPQGRHQAGDRHLKFHESWDNLAITAAGQVQPDVVLMDLRMPGIGGIEATTRITAGASADVADLRPALEARAAARADRVAAELSRRAEAAEEAVLDAVAFGVALGAHRGGHAFVTFDEVGEVLPHQPPRVLRERVEAVEEGTVADRQRISYRLRVRNSQGLFLVEQVGYLDARADGRIQRMHLMCAGFRPIPEVVGETGTASLREPAEASV